MDTDEKKKQGDEDGSGGLMGKMLESRTVIISGGTDSQLAQRIIQQLVLLDHADNVGSGGTEDVMTVIAEVLSQQLEDVAVAAVGDPRAVQEMIEAGVGTEVTVNLGGKTDMPSIGRRGESLAVTGRVRTVTDGTFVVRGPMYTMSCSSTR